MNLQIFEDVYNTILERKQDGNAQDSYVAQLMNKGLDRILKKIGEESAEVLIAAKNSSEKEQIHEISDLLFHLMILMVQQKISPEHIAEEFQRRSGISGLEEKAGRMPSTSLRQVQRP